MVGRVGRIRYPWVAWKARSRTTPADNWKPKGRALVYIIEEVRSRSAATREQLAACLRSPLPINVDSPACRPPLLSRIARPCCAKPKCCVPWAATCPRRSWWSHCWTSLPSGYAGLPGAGSRRPAARPLVARRGGWLSAQMDAGLVVDESHEALVGPSRSRCGRADPPPQGPGRVPRTACTPAEAEKGPASTSILTSDSYT